MLEDEANVKQMHLPLIIGPESMLLRHHRHVVEIGACLHAVPVIQQTVPLRRAG